MSYARSRSRGRRDRSPSSGQFKGSRREQDRSRSPSFRWSTRSRSRSPLERHYRRRDTTPEPELEPGLETMNPLEVENAWFEFMMEDEELDNKKTRVKMDFSCEVCNVNVSSMQALQIHFAGAKHQKKLRQGGLSTDLKDLNKDDMDPASKDKIFRCTVCDVVLSGHEINVHVKGPRHQTAVEDAGIESTDVFVEVNSGTHQSASSNTIKTYSTKHEHHCSLCGVTLHHWDIFQKHLQGKRHQKLLKWNEPDEEVIAESAGQQQFWCNICGIFCTNKDSLDGHLAGKKHFKMLKSKGISLPTVENQENHANPPPSSSQGLSQAKQSRGTVESKVTSSRRRSRSHSPGAITSRERRRSHSRSRSPVSTSRDRRRSRSRSHSPATSRRRGRSHSRSPITTTTRERRRSRSRSPATTASRERRRTRSRSRSPTSRDRRRSRSRSPATTTSRDRRRSRSRSRSPITLHERPWSYSRSQSPATTTSRERRRSRSHSPDRLRSRSRSPVAVSSREKRRSHSPGTATTREKRKSHSDSPKNEKSKHRSHRSHKERKHSRSEKKSSNKARRSRSQTRKREPSPKIPPSPGTPLTEEASVSLQTKVGSRQTEKETRLRSRKGEVEDDSHRERTRRKLCGKSQEEERLETEVPKPREKAEELQSLKEGGGDEDEGTPCQSPQREGSTPPPTPQAVVQPQLMMVPQFPGAVQPATSQPMAQPQFSVQQSPLALALYQFAQQTSTMAMLGPGFQQMTPTMSFLQPPVQGTDGTTSQQFPQMALYQNALNLAFSQQSAGMGLPQSQTPFYLQPAGVVPQMMPQAIASPQTAAAGGQQQLMNYQQQQLMNYQQQGVSIPQTQHPMAMSQLQMPAMATLQPQMPAMAMSQPQMPVVAVSQPQTSAMATTHPKSAVAMPQPLSALAPARPMPAMAMSQPLNPAVSQAVPAVAMSQPLPSFQPMAQVAVSPTVPPPLPTPQLPLSPTTPQGARATINQPNTPEEEEAPSTPVMDERIMPEPRSQVTDSTLPRDSTAQQAVTDRFREEKVVQPALQLDSKRGSVAKVAEQQIRCVLCKKIFPSDKTQKHLITMEHINAVIKNPGVRIHEILIKI